MSSMSRKAWLGASPCGDEVGKRATRWWAPCPLGVTVASTAHTASETSEVHHHNTAGIAQLAEHA